MTFDDPAVAGEGDRLNPRDIMGQLLILRPLEHRTGINTQYSGPEGSDAIMLDVACLDLRNTDGSNIWRGVMWFQGKLISSLKPKIGSLLLGRMSKGMGQPGRNQPFVIDSATNDSVAVARAEAWLAQHPEFVNPQPQAPVQQQQSATPQQQQTVLDRLRQQSQGGYQPGNGFTTQQQVSQQPPF